MRTVKKESKVKMAVLKFVRAYYDSNGFPPSLRDIMDGTGITSTSVVSYHLQKLVEEGLLNPGIPGAARTITPIYEEEAA